MTRAGRFVVLALALGAPLPALSQAPAPETEIEGRWDVRWAQGIRNNADGSIEIQRWGDAVLDLTVADGLVEGSWTTDVLERVVWAVSGQWQDGQLRLEGTENDSGNPELDIVERMTLSARLIDGALEGEVRLHIRGRDRIPGARPFTGQRGEEDPERTK
ncbi:MAG: hypothetical protein AAF389_14625 [Gemmatimonadota bacterium]